jgi:hypothetical protein
LINNFYPRSLIELKNYDVVVLAMGSQSVFLHLFDLPEKVAIELAGLLFDDKTETLNNQATNSNHKPKAATNSSSDYSILNVEQRVENVTQLGTVHAGMAGALNNSAQSRECIRSDLEGVFQGLMYLMILMLLFSRPRGDTLAAVINTTINKINKGPGLKCKPGFLFSVQEGPISEVTI